MTSSSLTKSRVGRSAFPRDHTDHTVLARESVADSRCRTTAANRARLKYGRRQACAMLALQITGHSGQEIAAICGVSRAAVYMRLSRLRHGRYNRASHGIL
jgi:DNA-directed RNA polymerase specialized sigma24 family protein